MLNLLRMEAASLCIFVAVPSCVTLDRRTERGATLADDGATLRISGAAAVRSVKIGMHIQHGCVLSLFSMRR